MSVSVKVNPGAEKANKIANEKSLVEACLAIQAQAKELAPKDTGLLRASITYKTSKVTGTTEQGAPNLTVQPTEGTAYVGSNVNYAPYQEFGTRNQKPQAFLRPAGLIFSNRSKVNAIIELFNLEMGKVLPKAK